MKKEALVTGYHGFVGRHITEHLLESGWKVLGIDNRWGIDVRQFFKEDSKYFDLVIHCAAVVGGRQMIENSPLQLATTDLSIDAALFNWAIKTKPGRIVYYSSSAAYPIKFQSSSVHEKLKESFINLDKIDNPDMTYGWVKLTGEMLASHARRMDIPVTVLRPFSGYGEDQSLDYPFPSFIKRANEKQDPFLIWGRGSQVRDWVHIDDVVEITMICAENNINGPLNIGNGRPISFFDLADMVSQAAGYHPTLRLNPDAPEGVMYRVADTTKLFEIYRPKISLEEGIERALNYV